MVVVMICESDPGLLSLFHQTLSSKYSAVRELSGNRKRATNTVLMCGREVDKKLIEDLKSKEYIIESLEKPVSADSLLKVIEMAS
jgi:hypothetical protein